VSLIGANIREHRKNLGMTQERLAELADINEKYLSSVENGNEANLSIGYIVSVAVAMQLPLLTLLVEKKANEKTVEVARD
jgi:transcriptional regulator with XRE-family HTH domain